MSDPCFLSIAEASALIQKGRLSPLELTEAHLARIDALDPSLSSYITVTRDLALKQAREATEQRRSRDTRGPLFGIPLSVKDNIATAGVRTTAASRVLKDWVPDADATVVTRLRAAGAIILGKASLSEFTFAGGASTDPFVPAVRNPWNRELSAGGSSSGSAAHAAAGLAMASIGSDSGGSIRIPSAFCGVTGLSPMYGRVGRSGIVALSYSMDVLGPIARDVMDAALVLEAIAGFEASDPSSSQRPAAAYSRATTRSVRGLRVGTCTAYVDAVGAQADVQAAVSRVVDVLRSLGMSSSEVTVPHLTYACAAGYQTIMRVEAFHHHFERMREHRAQYGAAFRNIARGGFLTTHDYLRGQQARALITGELRAVFEHADVLVLPVTPATPDGGNYAADGADVKVRKGSFSHGAAYTAPFNLTGSPAMSLPCGFTAAGMPIGVQFVARPFEEETLIAVGHRYQSTTDWHLRRPTLTP